MFRIDNGAIFKVPMKYMISHFRISISGALQVMASSDGILLPAMHIRFTSDDGLAENIVQSIAVAPDGVVWAGTENALSRYDGDSWMIWIDADGSSFDTIISLAVDHDGK